MRDFRLSYGSVARLMMDVMAQQRDELTAELVVTAPTFAEVVLVERVLRSLLDAESALTELRVLHDHPSIRVGEVRAVITEVERTLDRWSQDPGLRP